MNSNAQRRLNQIETVRSELMEKLDEPNLPQTAKVEIFLRLRALLDESAALKAGDHPMRGGTTRENKDLYVAVQRELAGKVIRS